MTVLLSSRCKWLKQFHDLDPQIKDLRASRARITDSVLIREWFKSGKVAVCSSKKMLAIDQIDRLSESTLNAAADSWPRPRMK